MVAKRDYTAGAARGKNRSGSSHVETLYPPGERVQYRGKSKKLSKPCQICQCHALELFPVCHFCWSHAPAAARKTYNDAHREWRRSGGDSCAKANGLIAATESLLAAIRENRTPQAISTALKLRLKSAQKRAKWRGEGMRSFRGTREGKK